MIILAPIYLPYLPLPLSLPPFGDSPIIKHSISSSLRFHLHILMRSMPNWNYEEGRREEGREAFIGYENYIIFVFFIFSSLIMHMARRR